MRIEGLDLVLRPRSMSEAADLGVALVHRHRASLWRCHAPLVAAVLVAALSTIEIAPWLPGLIVFWLKPWLDRSLLFVLSRAAFGEATRWSDVWRARGAVLWQSWFATLTWRRLSPWRSYTQPISQLEGQRGKALRARHAQILRYKRAAAAGMHMMFANVEFVFAAAAVSLLFWFAPEGLHDDVTRVLTDEGLAWQALSTAAYAAIVLVLEPFYVAAGFAMYLNRRVELEAWDVEQEFRRAFAH
jgi:hypothetical protein